MYALLFDDGCDFILTRRTNVTSPLTVLEVTPELDIVGGVIVDLPGFSSAGYLAAGFFSHEHYSAR